MRCFDSTEVAGELTAHFNQNNLEVSTVGKIFSQQCLHLFPHVFANLGFLEQSLIIVHGVVVVIVQGQCNKQTVASKNFNW